MLFKDHFMHIYLSLTNLPFLYLNQKLTDFCGYLKDPYRVPFSMEISLCFLNLRHFSPIWNWNLDVSNNTIVIEIKDIRHFHKATEKYQIQRPFINFPNFRKIHVLLKFPKLFPNSYKKICNWMKNLYTRVCCRTDYINWAPSSKFVSSSIPSWHILTAHAQPFKGARDLADAQARLNLRCSHRR